MQKSIRKYRQKNGRFDPVSTSSRPHPISQSHNLTISQSLSFFTPNQIYPPSFDVTKHIRMVRVSTKSDSASIKKGRSSRASAQLLHQLQLHPPVSSNTPAARI
jgi:hypothetical protein